MKYGAVRKFSPRYLRRTFPNPFGEDCDVLRNFHSLAVTAATGDAREPVLMGCRVNAVKQ